MGPHCCGCASPAWRRGPSSSAPLPSSPPAGRPVPSAASRWTRVGTSAPAPTATAADPPAVSDASRGGTRTPLRTQRRGRHTGRMTAIDVDSALQLLQHGEISVEGRLVDASNATLFCDIELHGAQARCVYKPIAGERPLWDFPDGTLAARELAT